MIQNSPLGTQHSALETSFSAALSSLGYFETLPTLAVAVSGGADSTALLLLTHAWAKKQGGRVVALTVDHRMRPESAQEAAQVKSWCKSLSIEHHTLLPTQHSALRTQSAARDTRYRLLTDWCRQHHVLHLLTAHHQADQAETLMFRLARGSGLDGLASISADSVMHGVRLLRPLLTTAKAALENFLKQVNQPWLEDPTNVTVKYARNVIRMNMTPDTVKKAADLAQRLGIIRYYSERVLTEKIVNAVSIYPEGYATIAADAWEKMEPGYALKLLWAVLQTVSGATLPARTDKLERLCKELRSDKKTRSFNGCLIRFQPAKKRFLVVREPNAIAPQAIVKAGERLYWDDRFELTCKETKQDETFRVCALGKAQVKSALPKLVISSLPSFWRVEELVAVPHIRNVCTRYEPMDFQAAFKPSKPLGFGAFLGLNSTERKN